MRVVHGSLSGQRARFDSLTPGQTMSKLNSLSLLCSRRNLRVRHVRSTVAIMLITMATTSFADVQSIQWHEDLDFDGVVTGSLAGNDVRLSSTDGPLNGGRNLQHPNQWWGQGTNEVPGLSRAHQEGAAVDWNQGEVGTVDVDLGTSVEDPIFMFAYLNGSMSFDFDDSLSLKLVDQGQGGFQETSVNIGAGNVIRTTGHTNLSNDGFAVAVKGTVSSLNLRTNLDLNDADSVSFSMVACNPTLGDFNCDGLVGFADFITVRENFGQLVDFAWEGDADNNGLVDFKDFLVVSENYGTPQAAMRVASVPEPGGLMLYALGVLLRLFLGRRKSRNAVTT